MDRDVTEAPLDPEDLIACPQCDALYRAEPPEAGGIARCLRCHTVLIAPRTGAFLRVLALSLTVTVLMLGAAFFPFLEISAAGLSNKSSIIDAALAFSEGPMMPLSLAVAAMILGLPLARMALLIYVLGPLVLSRAPARGAATAFRWSEDLRPWSMAEIFVIGTAVALVKVADLAKVEYGAAFWMFAGLVVVTVLSDGTMCRWSIWRALNR